MSVSVRVPTILRTYTKDAAEVTAEGGTLKEVLADLEANHPGIQARILDDGGKIRRFVNVYVGDEDVRFADGLDTAVRSAARSRSSPRSPAAADPAVPDPGPARTAGAHRRSGRCCCAPRAARLGPRPHVNLFAALTWG